jgi:KipI family sensor histidine kinase inhibitor
MCPLAEKIRLHAGMTELQWEGQPVSFTPLGDSAVTVSVGARVDPWVNDRVRSFADMVAAISFPGYVEAVAGYHTATVYYDAFRLFRGLDRLEGLFPGLDAGRPESLQDFVCALLRHMWEKLDDGQPGESRLVEIPVLYGGEYGPDLEEASKSCGLEPEEYASIHSSAEYRVYMVGFVPGFPYLGGMPKEIAVPRKDTPRVSVPAGSVAVGGGQTGIYPLEVPGGWNVIGRTSLRLFRPEDSEPSLLRSGDRVRFVPKAAADAQKYGFGRRGGLRKDEM